MFFATFQFVLIFLLALSLSVHTRHVGYRNRRADANPSNKSTEAPKKQATTKETPNDFEFWLRNLVVGPPLGAPHITLNVKTKLDDDDLTGSIASIVEAIKKTKTISTASNSDSSDSKKGNINTNSNDGNGIKAKESNKPTENKPADVDHKGKADSGSAGSKETKQPNTTTHKTPSEPKNSGKDKKSKNSDKDAPAKKHVTEKPIEPIGYEFSFR